MAQYYGIFTDGNGKFKKYTQEAFHLCDEGREDEEILVKGTMFEEARHDGVGFMLEDFGIEEA